jgi:hypothetical protein
VTDVDNDIDVCEEVEFVLEELFPALQDRVRIHRQLVPLVFMIGPGYYRPLVSREGGGANIRTSYF